MTTPVIRGSTNPAAGLSNTSPASTQVGDLVLVVSWERMGSAATSSFSIVSGYTELLNYFHNDGAQDGSLGIGWQIATSAGAQSYQAFTSSTASPTVQTLIRVYQAGTFASPPTFVTSTPFFSTVGNDAPIPPQVTGMDSTRDYLVEAVGVWYLVVAGADVVVGAPANHSNLLEVNGVATLEVAIAARAMSGVTSYQPGVFTDNITGSVNYATTAYTFALLGLYQFRRAQVGWAELEVGEVPATNERRSIVGHAEFEVPSPTLRQAIIGWAELQVPDYAFPGQISYLFHKSWARYRYESNNPTPLATRRALIGYAELEVPVVERRSIIGHAELEVPPVANELATGHYSSETSAWPTSDANALVFHDAWDAWLGRETTHSLSFLNTDGGGTSTGNWSVISGAGLSFLQYWPTWLEADTARRLLFSLALCAEYRVGGVETTPTDILQRVGSGEFDTHFSTCATNLLDAGFTPANTMIRLGWEMDGNWYPWRSVYGTAQAGYFAGAVKRVIQVMQQVAQWQFAICTTSDAGGKGTAYLNTLWGTGTANALDAYIHHFGIDLYDHWWFSDGDYINSSMSEATKASRRQTVWNGKMNQFNVIKAFAQSKGKPLAFHEWGCTYFLDGTIQRGGLDNPTFVENMYNLLTDPANNFFCDWYFNRDLGTTEKHKIFGTGGATTFPNAANRYKQLWGGG